MPHHTARKVHCVYRYSNGRAAQSGKVQIALTPPLRRVSFRASIRRYAVAALVALGMPLSGAAADGRYLLEACEHVERKSRDNGNTAQSFQAGYCVGAVEAVRNHIVVNALESGKGVGLCPAGGVIKKGDDVAQVLQFLRHHRDLHQVDAAVVIDLALKRAYPCR